MAGAGAPGWGQSGRDGQGWERNEPEEDVEPPVRQSATGALSWTPPPQYVEQEELMRRMRHGDPLLRRVGRGLRRAVGAQAAQDLREEEATAALLRRPVSTCRQIAVTSIRGGTGKSTIAALVARVIAGNRTDRTLALDADPGLGSLLFRLGAHERASLREVSQTRLATWDDAEACLSHPIKRLWAIPGTSGHRVEDELQLAAFRIAQSQLSRYFATCVVDCGPGISSELHQGILGTAHAQILVTPATVDGALSTRSALDWLYQSPYAAILARTVIVLVTHTPHADNDLHQASVLLSAEGVPVFHLPYDRHLAAGTAINPALLASSSVSVTTQLAAAAFTRAIRPN